MLTVPEYGGIHALVRVPQGKEFGIISSIKALQMLVMTYGENEVCLHHNKDLYDSDPVRGLVQFCIEGKQTLAYAPLIRGFKFENGTF